MSTERYGLGSLPGQPGRVGSGSIQIVPEAATTTVEPPLADAPGVIDVVSTNDLVGKIHPGEQALTTVTATDDKGWLRRGMSKLADSKVVKASGLTATAAIASEGLAHVGGAVLAAIPNPIDWTHNPVVLGAEILGTYGIYGISQWNTNHEAGVREDEGKLSYNKISTGVRNAARRVFPNSRRWETSGEQAGGFAIPGLFETEYWVGSGNAIGHLTSHQGGAVNLLGGSVVIDHRTASFIGGANLAAAGLNSYQTDASRYLRQQGREPRIGIKSLLDVATTVGPVTRIKIDRNVKRVQELGRTVKDNTIYRSRGMR